MKKLSLLKRIGILSILCFCLGFVVVSTDSQTVGAAPCCSECEINPVDPQTTPSLYCADLCGSNSNSCYTQCMNRIQSCWRWCSFSC